MSIDNGVYIIKDNKGYRVTEAQCIDNLWWWNKNNSKEVGGNIENWEKRDEINPLMVEEYFKDSKYYKTKEEAYKRAEELYKQTLKDYGMCEYGIQDLGEI